MQVCVGGRGEEEKREGTKCIMFIKWHSNPQYKTTQVNSWCLQTHEERRYIYIYTMCIHCAHYTYHI